MATDKLQSLAVKHGIASRFTDNFGNLQVTEPEVMRAILLALGESSEQIKSAGVDSQYEELDGSADGSASASAVANAAATGKVAPTVAVVTHGEQFTLLLDISCPGKDVEPCLINYRYLIEAEQGKRFDGLIELQPFDSSPDPAPGSPVEPGDQPISSCSSLLALQLPDELDIGYHRLLLEPENPGTSVHPDRLSVALIVVPARAYAIDRSEKPIGVSVQLYGLCSSNNWGIGDFTDLKTICSTLAGHGIDTVGLNPVHSLYGQHPDRCSPYSPSNRVFLNPLYIDVMAVPGAAALHSVQQLLCDSDFSARLASVRGSVEVDYNAVARLKRQALELIFSCLYRNSPDTAATGLLRPEELVQARLRFRQFVDQRGEDLQLHARFEAFDQYFNETQGLQSWTEWPSCYHDPDTPECSALKTQLVEQMAFSCFLQWVADEQLADAAVHSRSVGLRYGLYMDLAVGVDRQGGEVWAKPQQFARGMHIGAPPDALGPLGQDWSLTPYNPSVLRDSNYQAFVDVLRAAMRFAGILRIDHVMGLVRQYWCVPALRNESATGPQPAPGAYVDFPVDDLLGLVALESQRNQCIVIGEDLGTVPDGFREKLKQRGIYGYRVLYFERDDTGRFRKPCNYEPETLATASTHDLPTLAGYLNRRDILLRIALGQIEGASRIAESFATRRQELDNLLDLLPLRDQGWLDTVFTGQVNDSSSATPAKISQALPGTEKLIPGTEKLLPGTADFINAVHRVLAGTQSAILVLQLEDLLQQLDMANLPGTISEHPNWRRRLPVSLEALPECLSDREVLSDVVKLRKAG